MTAMIKNNVLFTTVKIVTHEGLPLNWRREDVELTSKYFSLIFRIVNVWNKLINKIVNAPSLNSFTPRLD